MAIPEVIVLSNRLGTQLQLTNVGASIMSFTLKDRNGLLVNVVQGFATPQVYNQAEYQKTMMCLGATIGRFAGRISNGGFTLNDTFYRLELNSKTHLHGGMDGFHHQIWEIASVVQNPTPKAVLSLYDTEGVFPGNLKVSATYELDHENKLSLTYEAQTDAPTVLNMTNHSYFNLNGTGTVLNHRLQINAHSVLETDQDLVPNGRLKEVKDTVLDYTNKGLLNKTGFKGLDTAYVLSNLKDAAVLKSEKTGIKMTVQTNQKALVVFTPKSLRALDLNPKNKAPFPAICFETQGFPDAPNQSHFPSTVLLPNENYLNKTRFSFTID